MTRATHTSDSVEQTEAIGFSELLEQGGVVVVEWAERVLELLPERRIEVRIEPLDEWRRSIAIAPSSSLPRYSGGG